MSIYFILFLFFGSFFIIFTIFIKYDIFSTRHLLLRIVVPRISPNTKKGIIKYSSIKWCTLPLSTYYDNGLIPKGIMDITHPSIIHIADSLNGYTHWLAASPYPQSLPTAGAQYENTCIFYANVSDENSHPTLFSPILSNPIIYIDDAQYNSDPNLFYDVEIKKIYCITRKRNGPDYKTKIIIQNSENGQSWSFPQPIITLTQKCEFLSPCLIKFNNKYRIYAFQTEPNNRTQSTSIDIWESDSLMNPKFIFYKSIKWKATMNIWHGSLFEFKNKYYLIFCGAHNNYKYMTGNKDSSKYLFLGHSADGENFTFYENPVLKMNGVYHSSAFVDTNESLVCYVSLHNRYHGDKHYISGNRIGMFEYHFDTLIDKLKAQILN